MTPRSAAITTLAEAIQHAMDPADGVAFDHLEALRTIKPILMPADFSDVCLALDVCPVHVCDIEICADDDEPDCKELRENA